MTAFPSSLDFQTLQTRQGLADLDVRFMVLLREGSPELEERLQQARENPDALTASDESELILAIAPILEDFLAEVFEISDSVQALQKRHHELAPLLTCKRLFVQRRVAHRYTVESVQGVSSTSFKDFLSLGDKGFAEQVLAALKEKDDSFLKRAEQYTAWRCFAEKAASLREDSPLFTLPKKQDFQKLFPVVEEDEGAQVKVPENLRHGREGFNLTDSGSGFARVLSEADYCLYCHQRDKDSCSKGLKTKEDESFSSNPLGASLTGCPLEQKISEMNLLRNQGLCLGVFATAIIDNPLLAATGERICNDCEKACIFQKQDPVDVPAIETQTLREVLALPWGFEIYYLLTQWNPLKIRSPLPREESGYQVLVAGMGPAGFTLAHYLLKEGHSVVGIDGLKIEPLPTKAFQPIHKVKEELFENLEERLVGGFGGVAEYGITVRWDKNFLTLIRIILERSTRFRLLGGVRLGSQVTPEEAIQIGFDHVALCLGAGRPKLPSISNLFAKGVRTASDFLMNLQLSGAYKKETVANLQVRLPALVIGGGLTAIDTATEVMAYYPRQVETFLHRYEKLVEEDGEEAVRQDWSEEDQEIADEFLSHAQALQVEREQAALEKRPPNFNKLLAEWGGVKLLYRRRLTESPAYRLNHKEVFKALQEGLVIQEETSPVAVEKDSFDALNALQVTCGSEKETQTLPAKSLFLALGTQPNVVLSREFPDLLDLDGDSFQAQSIEGASVSPECSPKAPETAPFVRAHGDLEKRVSFFGDLHPSFSGSVVKAMASAKRGYTLLTKQMVQHSPRSTHEKIFNVVEREWKARVESVSILGPKIVEIVVRAPAAARHFSPGQFFRLQNFEALQRVEGTEKGQLAMEGIALTGASADPETGLVSLIVLEMGGTSSLCRFLKVGEPVVLMGPTGEGTNFDGQKHLLIGGGLGNAVLFSIGKGLRRLQKEVLYVAAYKKADLIFKHEELEAAADRILWCVEEGDLSFKKRPGDLFFQGNVIEGLSHHKALFSDRDSLLVIGSDRMMHAVQGAIQRSLRPSFQTYRTFTASVNSPMQCMMKEICAQCLQVQKDPETGEETVVFTCTSQDQPLNKIDFDMLKNRLSQNSLQEKMTVLWQDRYLRKAL